MPKFQVETPDGLLFEIEGEQEPTAQELSNIVAQLEPVKIKQAPAGVSAQHAMPQDLSIVRDSAAHHPVPMPEEATIPEALIPALGASPAPTRTASTSAPETGSTNMWGNVLSEIFTPSGELRERNQQLAQARANVPQAIASEEAKRVDAKYNYQLKLLPWETDPAAARRGESEIMQRRAQEMRNLGFESVGVIEKPHLGQPMTRQQEVTLFGEGLGGRAVGAAQRAAQGFANVMVQPEMLPMAPGLAAIKSLKPVGKILGESFLPQMIWDFMAQGGETAGYASEKDWEKAVESGAATLTTGAMLAMPAHAAQLRSRMSKLRQRMGQEAEPSIESQLSDVHKDLSSMGESDPRRPEMLAKRADLNQRLELSNTWEDLQREAGRRAGREVEITDENLGDGNIATPRNGKILINRNVWRKLLEIDAKGDAKTVERVMDAIANQEAIHAAIPNSAAARYWKSLTDLERKFEESLYPFERGATDAQKGQEALRRRIEMANGMTPLEHLVNTGKGPMTARAMDALLGALRSTREVLSSSKAEKQSLLTQLATLNRAQERFTAAKERKTDASQNTQATEVHGDVRTQPLKGEGQVPVQEGGPGVRPETTERVEEKAQVLLSPEDAKLVGEFWDGTPMDDAALARAEELVQQHNIGPETKVGATAESEAPPTAPTGEAPQTAPAAGQAEAGAATPAVPAISTPKPEQLSRQHLMSAITAKEGIATKIGGDYVGTLHGRDRYTVDLKEGEGKPVKVDITVPEGSTLEQVKARMQERLAQYNEPFAKRRAGETSAKDIDKMDSLGVMSYIDEHRKNGVPPQYDSVLAGMRMTKNDLPWLTERRDESGKKALELQQQYMDSLKAGKPDEELMRKAQGEFGRLIWYNGAIEGAKRDGPNYRTATRDAAARGELPEPSPNARRAKYEEGVSNEDRDMMAMVMDRNIITVDGQKVTDPDARQAATMIMLDGYDATVDRLKDSMRRIAEQSEATGVSPESTPAYQHVERLMSLTRALEDAQLDHQLPEPNLDISFARRGKWKPIDKEQLGLGIGTSWVHPGEKKDILGKPVERGAAEVSAPEGAPQPKPPMVAIRDMAAQMAAQEIKLGSKKAVQHGPTGTEIPTRERKGNVVSFKNFVRWVKNNFHGVNENQIVDIWRRAVYDDLLNANADRLGEFVDAYDLGGKLGLRKDDTGKYYGIPDREKSGFELAQTVEGQKLRRKEPKGKELRKWEQTRGLAKAFRDRAAMEADAAKKQALLDRSQRYQIEADKMTPHIPSQRFTEELQGADQRQRRRTKIINAIAEERLRDTVENPDLIRSDIGIDDIDFGGTSSAYQKISDADARNPDAIYRLAEQRRKFKHQLLSHTRRLIAIVDLSTKKVHLVSAYNEGGKTYIVDPIAAGIAERPNRPVDAAFLRKYRPMASVLLKAPVKNFHKSFASVREYVRQLENDALERERPGIWAGEGELPGEAEPKTEADLLHDERMYWWNEIRGEEAKNIEGPIGVRQGGGMVGEHATEAKLATGIAPGEIAKSYRTPLRQHEVEAVIDWLHDEMGEVSTPDDVLQGMETLADLAKQELSATHLPKRKGRKPLTWRELAALPSPGTALKGIHRTVISAIQKIAHALYERSWDEEENIYQLTPQQAYETAVAKLTQNILNRASLEDYVRTTLNEFGPKPDESQSVSWTATALGRAKERGRFAVGSRRQGPLIDPVTGEALTQPGEMVGLRQEPPEKPPKQVKTGEGYPDVEWQRATPKKQGKVTEYSTVQEITRKPPTQPFRLTAEGEVKIPQREIVLGEKKRVITELEPGTFARRALPDALRRTQEQLNNAIRRRTVMRDIPRTLDGLENTGALEANDATHAIVMASIDKKLSGRVQTEEAAKLREAAIAVQSTVERPTRKDIRRAKKEAIKLGIPYVKPVGAPSQSMINSLIMKAELGMQRAQSLMRGTSRSPATAADRWVGNRWFKAAQRLHDIAIYARDNWHNPLLHEVVDTVRRELKDQLDKEHAAGMDTQAWYNYLPGLYEGEVYNEGFLNWGAWKVLGKNYRQAKKFGSYYDAIADGPFIPANYDVSTIVGHRIRRGNHVVARREWQETLKGIRDPVTGDPIATNPVMVQRDVPVIDPETGEVKLDDSGAKIYRKEYGWRSPDQNHTLINPVNGEEMSVSYGMKPIAVRKGFEPMVTANLARSAIRNYPVGRTLLKATSALKHGWVLMLDTFHPGRLSQYAAASMGMKQWRDVLNRGAWAGGLSALTYRLNDLPEAVARGMVSPEGAKWAMEDIPINLGKGKVVNMTRHAVMREMVMQGLNAGRISDAIYKDMAHDVASKIPGLREFYGAIIGPYNKWLFDKFVPGLIAETAMRNFERLNQKHPDIPAHKLMKDVMRDTNVTYGNMGRQGLFRDATLRDILQIFLLAPQWREGLFQKEARYIYRLGAAFEHGGRRALSMAGAGVDPSKNLLLRMSGREGMPVMGQLGQMFTRGLTTYFLLAQAINLITRGKFTWQNEEEGRKLDAYIPVGRYGMWLPTLGVFGEIVGDMIRYGETKGTAWEQGLQVGVNSLGPTGRMLNVLWQHETPTGKELRTTPQILGAAGLEMFPPPISLGTAMRGVGHAVAPKMVNPNEPGAVPQRVAGAVGLKMHRGTDPITQIGRMAREWKEKNNIPESPISIHGSEEEGLADFRHAINIDNVGGAKRIYEHLVDRYNRMPRGKGYEGYDADAMIIRALKIWRDRPFTGSQNEEADFRSSLSGPEEEIYQRADAERMDLYNKALDFIIEHGGN